MKYWKKIPHSSNQEIIDKIFEIMELYNHYNPLAKDNWRLIGGYRFSLHWDQVLDIHQDPNTSSNELDEKIKELLELYEKNS